MNTYQIGFGTLHYLLVTATVAVASFFAVPGDEATINQREMIIVADALSMAAEPQRKISDAFMAGKSLPINDDEADALEVSFGPVPGFVQDLQIQPGYAGDIVMIKVYLNPGSIEKHLAGEQYVSLVGIVTDGDKRSLKWVCGERNVGRNLLPEHCRS